MVLPAKILRRRTSTCRYAIAGHKAQGLTTDRAWVLGSDAAYREWGYVALSRSRQTTHLYVVNADDGMMNSTPAARQLCPSPTAPSPARWPAAAVGTSPWTTSAAARRSPTGGRQAMSRSCRSGTSGYDAFLSGVTRRPSFLTAAQGRLADATEQLEERSSLSRWAKRAHTRQARADIARLTGDVHAWRERLDALDDDLAQLRRAATNHCDLPHLAGPVAIRDLEIAKPHRGRRDRHDVSIEIA